MTFACLRCSDKSYSIQVLSKSSMWEHLWMPLDEFGSNENVSGSKISDRWGLRFQNQGQELGKPDRGVSHLDRE